MMISYASDGENPATMPLETLINNFNLSNAWKDSDFTEPALRYELEHRGWFENFHNNGRFLVLNLDRFSAYLAVQP